MQKPGGKPLFYQAKPVPREFQALISACQTGPLERVKALWDPRWLPRLKNLHRTDTCHPLLDAAHHLRVDVVEFLCDQGLSPFRPGTVHPYTGDGMVVSELQGISPMGLVDKMLFHHPRKSKRKVLLVAVKEVLLKAAGKLAAGSHAPAAAGTAAAGAVGVPDDTATPSIARGRERRERPKPTPAEPEPEPTPAKVSRKRDSAAHTSRKRRLMLDKTEPSAAGGSGGGGGGGGGGAAAAIAAAGKQAPQPTPTRSAARAGQQAASSQQPVPPPPTRPQPVAAARSPHPAASRHVQPVPVPAAVRALPGRQQPLAAPPQPRQVHYPPQPSHQRDVPQPASMPHTPMATPPPRRAPLPAPPTRTPLAPATGRGAGRTPAAAPTPAPRPPVTLPPLPFPSLCVNLGAAGGAAPDFPAAAAVPASFCTTVWPVVPAGVAGPQVLLRAVQALALCQDTKDLGDLAAELQTSLAALDPARRSGPQQPGLAPRALDTTAEERDRESSPTGDPAVELAGPPNVSRLHNTWASMLPRVRDVVQAHSHWLAHVHVPAGAGALTAPELTALMHRLPANQGIRAIVLSVEAAAPSRGAVVRDTGAGHVLLYVCNSVVVTRWVYRGSQCLVDAANDEVPPQPKVAISADVAAALYTNFLIRQPLHAGKADSAGMPPSVVGAGAGAASHGDGSPGSVVLECDGGTPVPLATPVGARVKPGMPVSGSSVLEGPRATLESSPDTSIPPNSEPRRGLRGMGSKAPQVARWCQPKSPVPAAGWSSTVPGASIVVGTPPPCKPLWPMGTADAFADNLADVTNAASLARLSWGWATPAAPTTRAVAWIRTVAGSSVELLCRVVCHHLRALVGSLVVDPVDCLSVVFILRDPPPLAPTAVHTTDIDSLAAAIATLRPMCLSGVTYNAALVPLPAAPTVPTCDVKAGGGGGPRLVRTTCDPHHHCVVGMVRLQPAESVLRLPA